MSDIKSKSKVTTSSVKMTQRSGKTSSKARLPRGMRWNEMFLRTRWEFGRLSSTGSGNIAAGGISPSIQSASEYSGLSSLFTEIKLISCTVTFTAIQLTPTAGTLHGKMYIGTNYIFNLSTFTNPAAITAVQNLAAPAECSTYMVRPFAYAMAVPSLEFSGITQDAPSAPTPWAGSPGTVCVWGDGLTASTSYFFVDVLAKYILRGRN